MSEEAKSTLKITSEHDCHWKDHFESTGDELFEARKEIDALQSQLALAREGLKKIEKEGTFRWKDSDAVHLEWYAKIAQQTRRRVGSMECNEAKIKEFAEEIIDQVLDSIDCTPPVNSRHMLMHEIASRLRWLWLDSPRPIKRAKRREK